MKYILNKGLEYIRAQPLSENALRYKESYTLTRKEQFKVKERIAGLLERKIKEK